MTMAQNKPHFIAVRPIAVLISDVHYSLPTLELADKAMRKAIDEASYLGVPLIVAGDLHDTKANLRGECVNTMLETFAYAKRECVDAIILVGNHDLLNEKGKQNSLNFLRHSAIIVSAPLTHNLPCALIPYQSDPEEFERYLAEVPKGSLVIMHQGVHGAEMGDYVHDKSAISADLLANYRVISGHYHKAQTIECYPGVIDYIGTPYTVTFAEANDGPKGFQILYSDYSMKQVPTNLRKHVIIEMDFESKHVKHDAKPGDLVWVKIKGPALELEKLTKKNVASYLFLHDTNFRLDKIPTDSAQLKTEEVVDKSNEELMDLLVDNSSEKEEDKVELKKLWRSLL